MNSENQLEISTSVLSNQNELIRLNLNISDDEGKGKVFNYELPLEEKFEEVLTPTPLLSGIDYLRGKQIRMNHAFSLHKNTLSNVNQSVIKIEPTRVEVARTFSSEAEKQNRVDESKVIVPVEQDERNSKIPKTCREKNFGLKEPCKSCQVECSLPIQSLIKSNVSITLINQELKNHSHPSSRPNRNKKEAIQELIDHYVYGHDMKITNES